MKLAREAAAAAVEDTALAVEHASAEAHVEEVVDIMTEATVTGVTGTVTLVVAKEAMAEMVAIGAAAAEVEATPPAEATGTIVRGQGGCGDRSGSYRDGYDGSASHE